MNYHRFSVGDKLQLIDWKTSWKYIVIGVGETHYFLRSKSGVEQCRKIVTIDSTHKAVLTKE